MYNRPPEGVVSFAYENSFKALNTFNTFNTENKTFNTITIFNHLRSNIWHMPLSTQNASSIFNNLTP